MIVFKRFSLLIFLFLCFSSYSAACDEEVIDALLALSRETTKSLNHLSVHEIEDDIQALLNFKNSSVLSSTLIPIHQVSSFEEAQPHIDNLEAGDIWFSDVDQTLVDNKFELMEAGIVGRVERAKKRKVSVLALTAAKHPNQYKEREPKKRNIRFSETFSHLSYCDGLSTLDKGILCSKGEEKGCTVERFLKTAFPVQKTKLRNNKMVFKPLKTPPKRVLVMDNLRKNLLHINEILQTFLEKPPFENMQVTLLHYAPVR